MIVKKRVEEISIELANGRVLANPIKAQFDFPPFRASIMDGFAVADCSSSEFIIDGESLTGVGSNKTVVSNNAVYITTGAPVPEGAVAVIMIEDCDVHETKKSFTLTPKAQKLTPGLNIRAVGSDFSKDSLLLSEGSRVNASDIGLLAMAGVVTVCVFHKPSVWIISTGHELMNPADGALGPGQIYDANLPMLRALVEENGGVVVGNSICRDDKEHLRSIYKTCIDKEVDVVISTGALSMGSTDIVKHSLMEWAEVLFGRVNLKPGKPMTAAVIHSKRLSPSAPSDAGHAEDSFINTLALPGNPVSAWVCATLFLVPLLKRIAGHADKAALPPLVEAVAVQDFKPDVSRPEFHRAIVWTDATGRLHCASTGSQLSSRLLSVKQANGIVLIPPSSSNLPVKKGDAVRVYLLAPPFTLSSATIADIVKNVSTSSACCPCGQNHSALHQTHSTTNAHHAASTPAVLPHPSSSHAPKVDSPARFRSAVVIVSDSCSQDHSKDRSGPAAWRWLLSAFNGAGERRLEAASLDEEVKNCSLWREGDDLWPIVYVSDDAEEIQRVVRHLHAKLRCHLVITSGGTGLSPRDVTLEAVTPLFTKALPGLANAMMTFGMTKTPMACLANCNAGIMRSACAEGGHVNTLCINVPGSVKAVVESLDAIKSALPHALNIMHQA
eukprot:GDKK01051151.1.p1 GENE.GDKK01051151.1~~GDKK01051151.1.p1  ORF type:complete len:700 (-),score=150.70 GDKK01051151.1:51-2057(-)